jgi:hypothetical protein
MIIIKIKPMKTLLLPAIISTVLLSSCATYYTYRFPNETETKRYPKDALSWTYIEGKVSEIPVVSEDGTSKTKLEAHSTYGMSYRFYLQSITVGGGGGLIGSADTWTGYELLSHTQQTVSLKDLDRLSIISDEKAAIPIKLH